MAGGEEGARPGGCGHAKRTRTQDVIVCAACGRVLGEDALLDSDHRPEQWLDLRHTQRIRWEEGTPVPSSSGRGASRTYQQARLLRETASAICAHFGISPVFALQALALADGAVAERVVNRGRSGRRLVAAAICVLCRRTGGQAAIPIAICDVALFIGEAPHDLLPLVTFCHTRLDSAGPSAEEGAAAPPHWHDPAIYVERYYAEHVEGRLPALMEALLHPGQRLGAEEGAGLRARLLNRALALLHIGDEHGLREGRRPQALAMAAIILCLECELALPSMRAPQKRLFKSFVKDIACESAIQLSTINTRSSEMRQALCLLAASLLPAAAAPEEAQGPAQIVSSLDEIITFHQLKSQLDRKIREAGDGGLPAERAPEASLFPAPAASMLTASAASLLTASATQPTAAIAQSQGPHPPSFRRSLEGRARREAQLQRAQRHIDGAPPVGEDDASIEDVVIQRLLLFPAVPREAILSASTLGQLMAIEELFCKLQDEEDLLSDEEPPSKL